MTTLYIDRKDIELRARGGALEFHAPDGLRGTAPLAPLQRVVIRGRVRLTTSVLGAMVDAGASVLMLSGRNNRQLAVCLGRPHNDVVRRLGQFDAFRNMRVRRDWSQALILAKIKAQHRLLRRGLECRPDKRRLLLKAAERLATTIERLSIAGRLPELTRLLGVEGAASVAYFSGFRELFPPSVDFTHRNRRPPRDPVNACLSLGYTLLHFDAVNACYAAGLDPMLGLYHEPAFGRASLASDVIEPLRPHVDEWVWELFRHRTLTSQSFVKDKGAVLLGKAGRQRFYKKFEPLARGLRRILRRQLSVVARDFAARGASADAVESRKWQP